MEGGGPFSHSLWANFLEGKGKAFRMKKKIKTIICLNCVGTVGF